SRNPPAASRLRNDRLFQCPSERSLQIPSVLESLVRILGKASPDHSVQRCGHIDGCWLPFQDGRYDARRTLSLECPFSAQHLVQYAAEAEQITARMHVLAVKLFRRHVLQGAENLSRGCESRRQTPI